MILHLSGEVNYAMVNDLVKAINLLPKENILHIYFTSPEGGNVDVSLALLDIIELHKERIFMHFYGEIFSSGMVIFLKASCTKNLLPDTKGMYHFSWQELMIAEGGKPTDRYDIFSLKEMKEAKNRTMEYLATTKLNSKELRLIKQGKDVYFSYTRLKELI